MFKTLSIKKNHLTSYFVLSLGLGLGFIASAEAHNYPNQASNQSYQNQGYYNQDQGYYNQANPNQGYSNYNTDRNNNSYRVSDQELGKRIDDQIKSKWFSNSYDQVNVQVNNGIVTLTGFVKTWDDKEKLDKEVRNIAGVLTLYSQVGVRDQKSQDKQQRQFPQDTFVSPADDQLNKKIRDTVSIGWLWNSYKEVALNTNNGVVTLEGVVDSVSDQQKLIDEVQKIEGVKAVKSNLRIKNR